MPPDKKISKGGKHECSDDKGDNQMTSTRPKPNWGPLDEPSPPKRPIPNWK